MVDRKPPHMVAAEAETLLELLQFQRDSLVRKVEGVSEEDARRSPVSSGTSLLWIMKHMSRAERIWVQWRYCGLEGSVPEDRVGPDDTLSAAVDAYRQTWVDVDRIVEDAGSLDGRARVDENGSPGVNLRWILMHLLEETARHAGHADILRELIDGETGR